MDGDDIYFSSKGHDAPGLYSVLIGMGLLEFDRIHRLRRLDGLPGHPDVVSVPQVNTNTGSLGMGISKAKGFARAARLRGGERRVFVLHGDGELQEGQFWESLGQAANEGLHEITAIVDHNKIQSDTWVEHVSDLGQIEDKVRAFGWAVARCDGNDVESFAGALEALAGERRPKLVIADTVKGSGVEQFEPHELEQSGTALYPYHSGAPAPEVYDAALAALLQKLNARLEALAAAPVELESAQLSRPSPPSSPQKLVAAYGEALADLGDEEERLVALDADLYLDTGLIPFRARHPERFVECGIAEQDMVSQAGALALSGLVPVVHSFACFLSTRPNEQIYNNTTEETKVIYVGTLVGIVPGGPGHSHQSVRDVSALGATPGMALIEPSTEAETRAAIEWAVREAEGPVYIRLVSVPWDLGFEPPAIERLVPGRGTVVREGGAATLVTTGPVMLSQAYAAAERLGDCAVVALPWYRAIDGDWLEQVAPGPIFTVDNHYLTGGLGDGVLDALAGRPGAARVHKLGVDRVPVCGSNDEVLRAHRLDADSLAKRVAAELGL
jgi:transketolase